MTITARGKRISELKYDVVKESILSSNKETKYIINNRLHFLENALNGDLPGKPDEAWRKINLSQLNIDEYLLNISNIDISIDNTENILIKQYNNFSKNDFEIVEKLISKINNRDKYDTNKVYTSDLKETRFLSMNEALSQDCLLIVIPKDINIKEVLNITISPLVKGSLLLPQIYIFMEEGSKAKVSLKFLSETEYNALSLGLMKVYAEKGANLELLTYQNYDTSSFSFHTEYIMTEQDAVVNYNSIQIGSQTALWENNYTMIGEDSTINVNKLVRADNNQYIGSKISSEHYSPYTNSNVFVKSVLDDEARTLFLGNIKIPKSSQKSAGYENSANLLLNKKSRAFIMPQLEIVADDVKCSHGATVGSLDREKLFYLTSRGISEYDAEKLLIKSFYQDILSRMGILKSDKPTKEYIMHELKKIVGINFDDE